MMGKKHIVIPQDVYDDMIRKMKNIDVGKPIERVAVEKAANEMDMLWDRQDISQEDKINKHTRLLNNFKLNIDDYTYRGLPAKRKRIIGDDKKK